MDSYLPNLSRAWFLEHWITCKPRVLARFLEHWITYKPICLCQSVFPAASTKKSDESITVHDAVHKGNNQLLETVSLLADEETTLLNLDVSFPNYTSLRYESLRLVGSSNGLVCCFLRIKNQNSTAQVEEEADVATNYLKWSVLLVGTADRGVYCLVSFSLHGEVFHVRPPPKELCFPENGHEYAYRIPLFSRNNSAAILASLHQMTDGEYFIEALWVISSSTTSTAKPAWVEQFRSRSKIYSGSRFVGVWKDRYIMIVSCQKTCLCMTLEVTQREILSHREMNKFWIGVNYVESLVPV
ncbi:hypothetical protein ACFX2I_008906 [Malus domestica]